MCRAGVRESGAGDSGKRNVGGEKKAEEKCFWVAKGIFVRQQGMRWLVWSMLSVFHKKAKNTGCFTFLC